MAVDQKGRDQVREQVAGATLLRVVVERLLERERRTQDVLARGGKFVSPEYRGVTRYEVTPAGRAALAEMEVPESPAFYQAPGSPIIHRDGIAWWGAGLVEGDYFAYEAAERGARRMAIERAHASALREDAQRTRRAATEVPALLGIEIVEQRRAV